MADARHFCCICALTMLHDLPRCSFTPPGTNISSQIALVQRHLDFTSSCTCRPRQIYAHPLFLRCAVPRRPRATYSSSHRGPRRTLSPPTLPIACPPSCISPGVFDIGAIPPPPHILPTLYSAAFVYNWCCLSVQSRSRIRCMSAPPVVRF